MKKHMIAFLITGALFLMGGAEGSIAAPVEADTKTEADAETLSCEKAGGLQRPEYHEIEGELFTEIYVEEPKNSSKGSAIYKSEWDSYSSNYYYNLLSEQEQALWDQMDAMCYEYLVGTESLTAQRNARGEWIYPTKSVIYSGMSQEEALDVALMFKYSNPQYYFLDLGVYGKRYALGGTISFTVFEAFANGSSRATATANMKAVIDNWMTQINAQPNDLLKEKKAHDLICSKVTYDEGYDNSFIESNIYNQVAYSVFCTDTTVCAGYSQAMQLLMNAAGIDCTIVTSFDHEWNLIRLNGTWYQLDLTWNDANGKNGYDIIYFYFNRSNEIFMKDAPRYAMSHTTEAIWDGMLPELTYDSGATIESYGSIHTPTAALSAPQIIASGNLVSFAAPTGSTVYYTTDGTSPSIAFTKADRYAAPFEVSGIVNIKAIAVANGHYDSVASEATVIPQYTVTFDANGGYIGNKGVSSISNAVIHGNAISNPANPKWKNRVFLGWYTKKSGGSRIGERTQITGNTTFYAQWSKIKPKKTAVSSLKNNSKKTVRVKIKNVKTASGYQIRYSTKKNMSSAKKKNVSENACTINNLKKGKTYYVQVRMYQKDSVTGKTKYGAWSSTKSVKIKK